MASTSLLPTAYRTHTCGELRAEHIGHSVTLSGWAHTVRDFGKFAFLVLRDRYGFTQITADPDRHPALYPQLKSLGRETVVQVSGKVQAREAPNPGQPTGAIEVLPDSLQVLNPAKLPPFQIEDETDGQEDLRLQYRYLDLRRPVQTQHLILRAQVVRAIRQYLDGNGFLEVETPVMIKTTPEGARDFLVPSRMHPGTFYALAQSPQILKQLLMIGGLDRYYQVCKCFRDEDFRGDRQPEFTQIDCEMAFASQEDVLVTFEGMVKHVYREVMGLELPAFDRLPYAEALARFGTDKPDRRFGNELVELNSTAAIQATDFAVFAKVRGTGKVIGVRGTGLAHYTRKQLDALTDHVKQHGAGGLVWIRFAEDGSVKSSVDKFFEETALRELGDALGCQPGDLALLVADSTRKAQKAAGALRLHLGKTEGWIDPTQWDIHFVVDFPLVECDETTGELHPAHHPFVAPHPEDLALMATDPEAVRAWCYDLVINGNELMSGSVRIHDKDVQAQIFDLLKLTPEEQQAKFGFLLDAFQYGAPPHAGCAFGLDRWVMLLAGATSLRDVIAFPKNSAGRDMMLDAPAPIDSAQLNELGLNLTASHTPT